jgi:hypothetical protein
MFSQRWWVSPIFYDVTVCRQVNSYWRFGGTCCLSVVYQLTECNTPTRLEPWVFMNSLSQRTKTNTPRFIVHSLQRPRSCRLLWKSLFIGACAKALQWTLFWTTWMQSTLHIILVKSQLSCNPSICGCFKWSLPQTVPSRHFLFHLMCSVDTVYKFDTPSTSEELLWLQWKF